MSISWDIHYLITRGGMTARLLLWFSYGRHGRATSLAVRGYELGLVLVYLAYLWF